MAEKCDDLTCILIFIPHDGVMPEMTHNLAQALACISKDNAVAQDIILSL